MRAILLASATATSLGALRSSNARTQSEGFRAVPRRVCWMTAVAPSPVTASAPALVLTTGLALITGTFFRFVARRLDTRPEDYEDAEISDGAGELGFYAPASWWPLLIALAASVTAVAVAMWLPWLIVAGGCMVVSAAAGLVFEFYVGPEKH